LVFLLIHFKVTGSSVHPASHLCKHGTVCLCDGSIILYVCFMLQIENTVKGNSGETLYNCSNTLLSFKWATFKGMEFELKPNNRIYHNV